MALTCCVLFVVMLQYGKGLDLADPDIAWTVLCIFWILAEPVRLAAGWYGNLQENVSTAGATPAMTSSAAVALYASCACGGLCHRPHNRHLSDNSRERQEMCSSKAATGKQPLFSSSAVTALPPQPCATNMLSWPHEQALIAPCSVQMQYWLCPAGALAGDLWRADSGATNSRLLLSDAGSIREWHRQQRLHCC